MNKLKTAWKRIKCRNFKKEWGDCRLSLRYFLLLAIFPLILAILFLFPCLNQYLSLNIYNPSWWQIITSHFVHRDFNHLIGNIGIFLLLGISQLVIVSRIKEEKKYFYLLLLLIASFPLVGSLVAISLYPKLIPSLKNAMGASGIVSAFFGAGYMLSLFVLSKKKWLLNIYALNISLIYVGLMLMLSYYKYYKNTSIIIFGCIALAFFLYQYKNELKVIYYEISKATQQNWLYAFSLILALLFFISLPRILFPLNVMAEKSMIDFFMHYIGIIYGLIFSFIYLNLFCKNKS